MRKDAKVATRIEVANIQDYHNGCWNSGEAYAYDGFKSNKAFASDRANPVKIVVENGVEVMYAVRKDGELIPLSHIGIEFETECKGVLNRRVYAEILKRSLFPLFPDDLFKMQHDGSLGYDIDYWNCDSSDDFEQEVDRQCVGIECITQPMSKQFIRNHYKDFKAMYDDLFPALGISCSESGRCGMHVNVSNSLFGKTRKQQVEAIRKLHYFINRYFVFCCKLFKRDPEETGYCGQMYYDNAKTMSISGGGHGSSMNYTHFDAGRIEIRLVGGQENFNTFRNTMEAVFFLIGRMRTIAWEELDDFSKVFKGCNQYVYRRLKYCGLNSITLEKIFNTVKEEDLELI